MALLRFVRWQKTENPEQSCKKCIFIPGRKRDRGNGSCFERKDRCDNILQEEWLIRQQMSANIKAMVDFIAEVIVYPGEDELKALAFNGLLALDGKIEIKTYI